MRLLKPAASVSNPPELWYMRHCKEYETPEKVESASRHALEPEEKYLDYATYFRDRVTSTIHVRTGSGWKELEECASPILKGIDPQSFRKWREKKQRLYPTPPIPHLWTIFLTIHCKGIVELSGGTGSLCQITRFLTNFPWMEISLRTSEREWAVFPNTMDLWTSIVLFSFSIWSPMWYTNEPCSITLKAANVHVAPTNS